MLDCSQDASQVLLLSYGTIDVSTDQDIAIVPGIQRSYFSPDSKGYDIVCYDV